MNPLGLKAVAIVAVVAFAAGSSAGWRVTSWAYQSAQAKAVAKAQKEGKRLLDEAIAKHAGQLRDRDLAEMQLATMLDSARLDADRLARAAARIPLTVEVPREGQCPDVRLSDAWGVCFRAGLTADAATLAECEAAGRDPGAVPPSGGSVPHHGQLLEAHERRAGGDAAQLLHRDRPGVPSL